MSLSSALNTATQSLAASQAQTAIVSRNISNVNTPGATLKYANVVTGGNGGVEVRSISQSQNTALFRNALDTNAVLAKSTAVSDGLARINDLIGDTDKNGSPAAKIAALSDAMQDFATTPASDSVARTAVFAARDVAANISDAYGAVDQLRRDADDALSVAADDMNAILAKIEKLNVRIVAGTAGKTDVTDEVDERNRLITQLSGYVGVSVQTRENDDVALYTDSGVTLLDRTARKIEFARTYPLADGKAGNAFKIDGTTVTGASSVMPLTSGKVAGLVQLRDETTVTYQAQLDTMADGLVAAFQEVNATNPADKQQGLFQSTKFGQAGSARSLSVAAAALADPFTIRDGGINGANFEADVRGSGDNSNLNARIANLAASLPRQIDGSPVEGSLVSFAASSLSWLQGARSDAMDKVDYQKTLLDRTNETLSNATGINLDTELTKLLDLQRSYQASSKIITTVDAMMNALLTAI
ncbi:flagellar hook-associated protein FlgK [Aureimonas jatrophae]|uniref:Flagellar hook-associated protein 1 n=1 Tax=Aureimonas jatrophae TaxID=1166073 RepID=A0A1H0JGB9_9HYPH|nr:flagellar hook-associated protein FlgK [Aureimonas jatrophae]MBB3951430.1 flagellar hook-associated protein 1 FlgK [Aureimonas jatrophae]SDO42553.1 flagellar hook-associated protein 1 FlgK [Aureimonas jatrophae]